MPPKPKFTKEQIVDAALAVTRQKGFSQLTARSLARELGSSACPVFTVFESMGDVQQATIDAAKAEYSRYVERGLQQHPAFKGIGIEYIRFATQEPELFRLLFMRPLPQEPEVAGVLPIVDDNYDRILRSVQDEYGLDSAVALKLYEHLWIYTHGIATLCATKTCRFAPDQISKMLTEVFVSLLKRAKEGEFHD